MTQMKFLPELKFLILLTALVSQFSGFAQQQEKALYEGQFAPSFTIKDIDGKFHSPEQYKGQKILLTFYRNAADPVSNYRFQEIEKDKDYFIKKGVVLLAVYESSPENVLLLRDTHQYFQIMVTNPNGLLYDLYGVEQSKAKITKGKLHGLAQKIKEGKKTMAQKIAQDGSPSRMSADFLIDENGNILLAYYAKYLGDHVPFEQLKNKIN